MFTLIKNTWYDQRVTLATYCSHLRISLTCIKNATRYTVENLKFRLPMKNHVDKTCVNSALVSRYLHQAHACHSPHKCTYARTEMQ